MNGSRRLVYLSVAGLVFTALATRAANAATCSGTGGWATADDDGDGVCNGADICPFEPNPPDANGLQDPSACAMHAVTVPAVPANPAVPHVTYSGATITLKGVARYGGDQYQWDYGDGSPAMPWTAIGNPNVLSATHAYAGAVGRLFIARLSVRSSANPTVVSTAQYPIQIQQSADLTDPVQMDVRISMAIDQSLWYLHTQMSRNWYGAAGASAPYGFLDGGGFPGTCAALDALDLHGSQPLTNYSADPYVEDTRRLTNWLLTNTSAGGIADRFHLGNPDTNGNGIGLYWGGDSTYVNGICAAALASTAAPNMVAEVGGGYTMGRTMAAIVQDAVDWFGYTQTGSGGWWYSSGYSSGGDGSTNQWPIIAMVVAKANMGVTLPPGVINYTASYVDSLEDSSGGFGYTSAGNDPNVAKTGGGIVGNYFLGRGASNDHVLRAIGFIYNHWSGYSGWDANVGYSYAMYDVMKAMRLMGQSRVTQYGGSGSFDWYYTPAGQSQTGIATYLVGHQAADGHWTDTAGNNYLTTAMNTAWDSMILNKGVAAIPPQAAICNCTATYSANQPVTFDASCSSDNDSRRQITRYDWDFNYDGTNFVVSSDLSGNLVETFAPYTTVVKQDGFTQFTQNADGSPTGTVYNVALRVTDNTPPSQGGPLTSIATCKMQIKPPPHCPRPSIGGPYLAYPGKPITFDASGSSDVDGDPLTYAWDLQNNNQFADGTGAQVTYTFGTAGTYVIGLKTTDHPELNPTPYNPCTGTQICGPASQYATPNGDCSVQTYATVIVGDHAPVAMAGGPYTSLANQTVQLDGTGSYSPDGNALTYAWDLTGNGLFSDSTAAKPTFTVGNAPGGTQYNVCVKVTDTKRLSSVGCTTVKVVVPVPPVCSAGSNVARACTGGTQTISLDGTRSYDPNGGALTYQWTTTCPGTVSSATSALGTLSTSTAGIGCSEGCSATLTVTNPAFGMSSSCTSNISIVDNAPPTFTTAPSSRTIECDANTSSNLTAFLGSAAAADACLAAGTPIALSNNYVGATSGTLCPNTSAAVGVAVPVTFSAQACTATAQTTATVTVVDTTPPVVTVPADITTVATATQTPVSFTVSALDFTYGSTAVTCTPASGAAFPVGTTQVGCSSTDGSSNTGTKSFNVFVRPAPPTISTHPLATDNHAAFTGGSMVNASPTTINVYDGNTLVGTAVANATTGAWSFDGLAAPRLLQDGVRNLSFTTLSAGQESDHVAFSFTLFTQAPGLIITAPANGSTQGTASQPLAYGYAPGYTLPAGVTIKTVTYALDGKTVFSGVQSARSVTDLGMVAPGSHLMTLVATDSLGNANTTALTSNFTYGPTLATDISLTQRYVSSTVQPSLVPYLQNAQQLLNGNCIGNVNCMKSASGYLTQYQQALQQQVTAAKVTSAVGTVLNADVDYLNSSLKTQITALGG